MPSPNDMVLSEEDFETILTALSHYEKDMLTLLVVEHSLKKCEDLTDEQAFVKAFSKDFAKDTEEEIKPKAKEIREAMRLLSAKVVGLMHEVRHKRLANALTELLR